MDINSYIGYYVSLTCDNNSIYEGEVADIDSSRQLITLSHAYQLFSDGNTVKFPKVTITGNHIKHLKIVREQIKLSNDFKNRSKSKSPKVKENCPSSPTKHNSNKTFSDIGHQHMYPDFDFEKNLAKFDKHAVYEEMLQNTESSLPNGIPNYDRKMRSQENVLESEPVSLRQIKVPIEHAGKEYSTKDGYIVPAITLALKKELFSTAEKAGLSLQQMIESAGVCTCQMALHLVGGSLRINPRNHHQRPEIVIIAGPHIQGLQAICAARHLVNHTVKVTLYLPNLTTFVKQQVDLFTKSGGRLIRSYRDLPTQPLDMIIDAMIGLDHNANLTDWLPYAISWANQNKAPLLSIDPCSIQDIESPDIKWTIAMGLPIIKSPKSDCLYLADVGIPRGVYSEVGIKYISPFQDKFYIPLYDC